MTCKHKAIHCLWLLPIVLLLGWRFLQFHESSTSTHAKALTDRQVALIPITADVSQGQKLPIINESYACAEPENLINLYAQKDRGFSLASSEIELTEDTFAAAKAMFIAAAADGVDGFILSSGYRSHEKQAEEYAKDPSIAARPGHSEHGSGLAFDVTAYGPRDFSQTPQYAWLYANCWDHGFILRYPADKTEQTGIPAESWHYRYVGQPHARIMGEMGLCLEEYVVYLAENGPFSAEYQGQCWIIGVDNTGIIRTLPRASSKEDIKS